MNRFQNALTPGEGFAIRSLLLFVLLGWGALISSMSATALSEVDQSAFVKSIADISIEERTRSRVPASITAAQAILESNWGRAPIAVTGNNYFGIKCKSYWTGPTVSHRDDDYDADGNLVESCFRAYSSVAASFRDHSDFLTGSARYAELFELQTTDYKSWAEGLKRCGYATDPAYAYKLIALIERLELYTLDWPQDDALDWLMDNSESGVRIIEEKTFMVIPDSYAPTGRGAEAILREEPIAPAERQ